MISPRSPERVFRAICTNGGPAKNFFAETVLSHDGDECLIWPFYRDKQGYGRLNYQGRLQYVSRLVCEQFNGSAPTDEHQAAHSCGHGHLGCVSRKHLSWKTRSENSADKREHGTHGQILKPEEVREIRKLQGALSFVKIAAKFNVHPSTVRGIQSGRRWAWLT